MNSGGLRVARGGSGAKAPPLCVRLVGNDPGQFLGFYEVNWMRTTHLIQRLSWAFDTLERTTERKGVDQQHWSDSLLGST